MGKIAFIFPGQGAQYPGMGASFYENSPEAKEVFEIADRIRPETSTLCFSGSAEDLQVTANTQPALFAVELAEAKALEKAGIKADVTAGFSLGELSALTYAGVFDLETGMALVSERGKLMQNAAEEVATSMVAVVRLENEKVEELCDGFEGVYPVNYNCPGQVSVAGLKDQMPAFSEAVKAAGGRAIPIKVSGGFHSPFMDSAAQAFVKELEGAQFQSPSIPVYSNFAGTVYPEDMKETLAKQINHPVRWQKIIEKMIDDGVDTFIEVGPGKTLSGFVGKINKEVKCYTVSEFADMENIVQE